MIEGKEVDCMRLERAEEILNSPDRIDVFYNNSPVWIENIDSSRNSADVTLLDKRARMNVPVSQLHE